MAALYHHLPLLLLLSLAGNHYHAVFAAVHVQSPPGELILIDLDDKWGYAGGLAARGEDISLAGFANRSRHWHAFRGKEHLFRDTTATPLPFGGSYRDLIGGLENLPALPIGYGSQAEATRVLSSYDAATATAADVDALKRALATLTVTTCEAQRLRAIQDIALGGREDARVQREHLPYVEHWDAMYYELKRWKRSGKWGGPFTEVLRKEAKIGSAKEALAVVGWTIEQMVMGHGLDDTCRAAVQKDGSISTRLFFDS